MYKLFFCYSYLDSLPLKNIHSFWKQITNTTLPIKPTQTCVCFRKILRVRNRSHSLRHTNKFIYKLLRAQTTKRY